MKSLDVYTFPLPLGDLVSMKDYIFSGLPAGKEVEVVHTYEQSC